MRLGARTRILCAAARVTLAILLAGTQASAAGPATERLRQFFATINAVLTDPATQSQPLEKVARIKQLVSDIADVRGAAAAVLDRDWDARTPAERDEFAGLFAELLERGLVARLAGAVSPVNGMVVSWRDETRVGEEARVTTVVEARDGRKLTVEYRMVEQRGRWLVRDVVVDGVSTIDNYRAQFRRVLRQGSYAGLVAQLRAKLGEETLMFAQAPPPAVVVAPSPSAERVAAPRPAVPRAPVAAPVATVMTPPTKVAAPPKIIPPPTKLAAPTAIVTAPATVVTPTKITTPTKKTTPATPAKISAPEKVVAASSAPSRPTATKPAARTVSETATPDTAPPTLAPAVPPPSVSSPASPPLDSPTPEPIRVEPIEVETVETRPMTAADVLSPVRALELTEHLLPSIVAVMLGFAGVTTVVCLRRRASASALVLQRFGDRDKRLVLVHPVPRVAKVGERGGKRRVVPASRHPARHVNDAHRA